MKPQRALAWLLWPALVVMAAAFSVAQTFVPPTGPTGPSGNCVGCVHLSGDETVAGTKTFADIVVDSCTGCGGGGLTSPTTLTGTVSDPTSFAIFTIINGVGSDGGYAITGEDDTAGGTALYGYSHGAAGYGVYGYSDNNGYPGYFQSWGVDDKPVITGDATSSHTGTLLTLSIGGADKFHVTKTGAVHAADVPAYADNAAAVTGGLAVGDFYRTGDALKVVH